MTDALTRAARAVANYEARDEGSPMQPIVNEQDRGKTRAAILAFLSGEDVVEACARALAKHMPLPHDAVITAYADQHSIERAAKHTEWAAKDRVKAATAAIAALRALVQEEK